MALPAAVEFGGVLTEVPDVAATVLGVVVAGPFIQDVFQVKAVLDDSGPNARDHPGPRRRREQVERLSPSLMPVATSVRWGRSGAVLHRGLAEEMISRSGADPETWLSHLLSTLLRALLHLLHHYGITVTPAR